MFNYTFRSGSAPQYCDYQVQYCRDCVEARDDCGTAAMSPTCEQFCIGKRTLSLNSTTQQTKAQYITSLHITVGLECSSSYIPLLT